MLRDEYTFTSKLPETLQRLMTRYLGWTLQPNDASLANRMRRLCAELGCFDPEACNDFLERHGGDEAVLQAVAREFGVGESYFFRDKAFFRHFEQEILPEIMAKGSRHFHLWSVGCSRGEELYSVAMLLHKTVPDLEQWDLQLLGTDVNTDLLACAEAGIYSKWSLRGIPEIYLRRYFVPVKGGFELLPEIRHMARFEYHNIASDAPPPLRGFDMILLRNILIYLDTATAKSVVAQLFSRLEAGGWLVSTAAEYSHQLFDFGPMISHEEGSMIRKRDPADLLPRNVSMPEAAPVFCTEEAADEADKEAEDGDLLQTAHSRKSVGKRAVLVDHHACYEKAVRLLEAGEKEEAVRCLRQSLYLESGFVEAHIALGSILQKEGKREAAMRHLERAKAILAQKPPDEVLPYSGGMTANDLLAMIGVIEEGRR